MAALTLALPGRAAAKAADVFPETIPLPNGFRPEGITIGKGAHFYVGSLADGAIYHGSLQTGEGAILVPGQEGRVVTGLSYDKRTDYIFAAGGPGGAGYVFDAHTGDTVAEFSFTTESATFVNDVVVTLHAAYFTDSSRPFLYRVPLNPDGSLPDPAEVEEIPLSGDFQFIAGAFNTNGIDAPFHGMWLVIVHSNLGLLYIVDPATGEAQEVDLGGDTVVNGDGILLKGNTLYVVQNFLNQISVVKLNPPQLTGEVVDIITDPAFRIPTTVDNFGAALYVVNARFDVQPTPDTEYEVVRVWKSGNR